MGLHFQVHHQQNNMFALKQVSLMALLIVSAYSAPQLDLEANARNINTEDYINPNPTYNYEYQVADEEAQTYITHQEGREDNVVTGQYSYVDPYGTLITVDYIADSNGYRETRTEQKEFVQIRAVPITRTEVVRPAPAPVVRQPAPVVIRQKPAPVRKIVKAIKPIVEQVVKQEAGTSDSDLVARIISQLTPFIRNTVSSSLGSSANAGSARSAAPAPAPRPVPVRRVPAPRKAAPAPIVRTALPVADSEATAVQNIFGFGGPNNVKVTTPDFDFAYDLSRL